MHHRFIWNERQRIKKEHACSDCPSCWAYDQTPELPPNYPTQQARWRTAGEPRQILRIRTKEVFNVDLHCGHTVQLEEDITISAVWDECQLKCGKCQGEYLAATTPPDIDGRD